MTHTGKYINCHILIVTINHIVNSALKKENSDVIHTKRSKLEAQLLKNVNR